MVRGIEFDQDGALLTVRLNNGDGNEFTLEMCRRLTSLLENPPKGSLVLLISAEGPNFCTGRDRAGKSPRDVREMGRALADVNAALISSSLAVVARVSGDAHGFGVGLLALADVAIAVNTAKFSFPEVRGGLAPALVLTWLPYVIGRRQAFWMTSTGGAISADEAERLGMINASVPVDQLNERISDVVGILMEAPQEVLAGIKEDLLALNWKGIKDESYAIVDRLTVRSLVLADEGH